MAELGTFKPSADLGDKAHVDGEGAVARADITRFRDALPLHHRALGVMSGGEPCALVDANALYAQLNQFTGSSKLYRHWLKTFCYTEGVAFLAERTRCYWLIDLIAIQQVRALKDAWLREFQLWELVVKDRC